MPKPTRVSLAIIAFLPLALLMAVVEGALVVAWISIPNPVVAAVLKYALLGPLVLFAWWIYQSFTKASTASLSGVELSPDDAPELWELVTSIATRVGIPAPTRVMVTPDPETAARQDGADLDVTIGLPLLATLTTSELSACIAHDLGHLTRRDAWSTRIVAALDWLHALRAASTGGLGWLLGGYVRLYGLAAGPALVVVEQHADELAVQVAGREATLSALRRLAEVGGAWGYVGDAFLPLFDDSGRRASLLEALNRVLESVDDLDEQVDAALSAEPRLLAAMHLPLRDRIAAIQEAEPAEGPAPDRTPATELVRGGIVGLDAIESELLIRDWPEGTWDEVAAEAGSHGVHVAGHQLGTFLLRRGMADSSLGGVVRILEGADEGRQRLYELLATDEDTTVELLVPVIASALVDLGAARFVPDWPDPLKLVAADGSDLDLSDVAARACEVPGGGAYLRDWLTSRGVNLDAAVGRQDPERPDWIAAISHVTGPWTGRCDVHFWSTGLLALPIDDATLAQDKATAFNQAQRDRMARAMAEGFHACRAVPGAFWMERADVLHGTMGRKRLRLVFSAEVATGQTYEFATTLDTEYVDSDEDAGRAIGFLLSIPLED